MTEQVDRLGVIERTIYVCPLCAWWEGDANLEGRPQCNGWPDALHRLVEMETVTVAPTSAGAVDGALNALVQAATDDEGILDATKLANLVHQRLRHQSFGGQSSPAGCPACSRVPGVARPPHTCSGEQS